MPDLMTNDSSTRVPLQPGAMEGASLSGKRAKPPAAKRPKRPRPTFEDGSLTRTFKFPSKTYPRSSYYVTSTEIIIRIKKARKKWKLIIPKKRVVSYRTNRWFAKPRWIAIELTFTQAVKLGLAEARAPQPDAVLANAGKPSEPASQSDPAAPEASPNAALLPDDAPFPVNGEAAYETAEPEAQDEPSDAFRIEDDDADDEQVAADQDEPEAETEAPLAAPPAPDLQPAEPIAEAVADRAPTVVVLADRRHAAKPDTRALLRRSSLTLAAAATGFLVWAGFEGALLRSPSDCSSRGPAADCAGTIVTGSVDPGGAPEHAAAVDVLPGTTTNIDDGAPGGRAAPADAGSAALPVADEKPEAAARPDATSVADAIVVITREIAMPQAPPVFAAAEPPAAPAAATETMPGLCDTLGSTARDMQITFDYGSAQLDPAVRAAIEAFAGKLRACPARAVTIEGHTDSDGSAGHNRTLSLRRAEAVQKVLVAAGIAAERLSAAGFGQTRPLLPNVSAKNKRNNRRAVLIVSTRR